MALEKNEEIMKKSSEHEATPRLAELSGYEDNGNLISKGSSPVCPRDYSGCHVHW